MTLMFRTKFTTSLGSWTASAGSLLGCILDTDSSYITSGYGLGIGNRFKLEVNPFPAAPSAVVVTVRARWTGNGGTARFTLCTLKDAAGNLLAGGGIIVPLDSGTTWAGYAINLNCYAVSPNIDGAWELELGVDDTEIQIDQVTISATPTWSDMPFTGESDENVFTYTGANLVDSLGTPEDTQYALQSADLNFEIDDLGLYINGVGLPSLTDVQVFGKIRPTPTGAPMLYRVVLFDAAMNELFARYSGQTYSQGLYFGLNLTKNYFSAPDTSGSWRLRLTWYLDLGEALTIDWVGVTYNATGGGGGGDVGPGQQRGRNAAFFLGMCGPLV